MKGAFGGLLHSSLTKYNFDLNDFVKEFRKKLMGIERKKDEVTRYCYDNMEVYLRTDIKKYGHKLKSSSNTKETNRLISNFLRMKYYWVPFYVITVNSATDPSVYIGDPVLRGLSWVHDNKQIRTYIVTGSDTAVESRDSMKSQFENASVYRTER